VIGYETAFVVGVFCLIVEAFFSGSEIALVSSNRALVRRKAQQGDRGAQLVQRFLDQPQVLLATTLIGTNLATVTFSVTVTLALVGGEGARGGIWAVLIVSPCTLFLGEVLPKSFFQHFADRLAPRIALPLHLASVLVRPGVWLLSWFAGAMTRLLGTERARAFVTREELALLIEADAERPGKSEITEDEREMISNVLEMSERTVDEIMVPLSEVVALPEDATVHEAAVEVADKQHTRIPIYRSRVDDIIGIVHAFDILRSGPAAGSELVTHIARPPTFVPESKLAVDLLVELQGTGNQMAVVVDEYGGATGIISVEDIIEEIVGEIEDEYDTGPSPLRREAPGVWRVQARTSVERVNEELGVSLPIDVEAYESIGGLILERLRRIPRQGESLRLGNVTLTVLRADERAIDEVRIRVAKRG
jgi:putative hemolysin